MYNNWIKRTKRMMKERKIMQKELVAVMGVTSRGAIGHYLSGRSEPSLDQLQKLAKFFGVSMSWLISEQDNKVEIDDQALELCIELIEEARAETGIKLSPHQAARLSVYLYDMIKSEGEEVAPEKVNELLRLYA